MFLSSCKLEGNSIVTIHVTSKIIFVSYSNLVTFSEEVLKGKLHFLCIDINEWSSHEELKHYACEVIRSLPQAAQYQLRPLSAGRQLSVPHFENRVSEKNESLGA